LQDINSDCSLAASGLVLFTSHILNFTYLRAYSSFIYSVSYNYGVIYSYDSLIIKGVRFYSFFHVIFLWFRICIRNL